MGADNALAAGLWWRRKADKARPDPNGVSWLLHLDVYKQQLNPRLALSVKPDFVGTDSAQQWIVIESKGRTGSVSKRLLRVAKRQTRSLRNINGQLPALRVAIAAYFSGRKIRSRICDPNDFDRGAKDLKFEQEAFARAYYRPIVECLESYPYPPGIVRNEADHSVYRHLIEMDASIGLDQDILGWYHGSGQTWQQILTQRAPQPSVLHAIAELKPIPEGARKAVLARDEGKKTLLGRKRLTGVNRRGLDGVTIELGPSWSEKHMRRQPKDRAD